jgi:hypothetical protein
MKSIPLCLALVTSTLLSFTVHAADQALISPQAGARTYAQNYKGMVLATCMTQAYRNDTGAANDAGSSASALRDWTYFDMEKSPDAVKSLVNRYLARDYSNPLVESDIKGVRFDFLKCMDLYHSKALEDLVKRLVIHPKHTYRQENPSRATALGAAAR